MEKPIQMKIPAEADAPTAARETPGTAAERRPFDLHAELAGIAKFSKEELSNTTPEERIAEKRKRRADFRETLGGAKRFLGGVHAEMEKQILEEGDVSGARERVEVLEEMGVITPEEAGKYRDVLDEAFRAQHAVTSFYRDYGAMPPEAVYKKLFGRLPYGKVDVIFGNISVEVACNDIRDFGYIIGGYLGKNANEKEDEAAAKEIEGITTIPTLLPELSPYVTAINKAILTDTDFKAIRAARIHEEKHVADLITEEGAGEKFSHPTPKELFLMNEEERDDFFRRRAKREIFAYLKEGRDIASIYTKLASKDGGAYDYYSGPIELIKLRMGGSNEEYATNRLEARRAAYEEDVRMACSVVSLLQKKGFSNERIIGMLQHAPLIKWKKEYMRI